MIKEFEGVNRYLSNFYPSEVTYEGETYATVEHAYQAAKTLSKDERKVVRECTTPGRAKRAGRRVILRPDWDGVRINVMYELVRRKFKEQGLRVALLSTGEQKLQEGNNWNDKFWGVDLKTGVGKNYLGLILMEVRKDLHDK